MSPILPADDPVALDLALRALENGELVVIPTDTVYGLAARPDRPGALDAVFAAKGRPAGLALPVLVAGTDQARRLGVLTVPAEQLAAAFWPGALTLVLHRQAGFGAALGGDGATVGVRMPAHLQVLRLLEAAGPLAVTSANRSGQPTPATAAEIAEVFGRAVAVYLDGGPSPGSVPSTVVSFVSGEPVVLREGALPSAELLARL
jgi:L-threonylcarbamoyladenylate synthase